MCIRDRSVCFVCFVHKTGKRTWQNRHLSTLTSILTLRLSYEHGMVKVFSEYNIRKVLGLGAANIAYVMKEKSSLTLGDIQSVLTNFVEAMITTLYSGQSVNIKNFGVFSCLLYTSYSCFLVFCDNE